MSLENQALESEPQTTYKASGGCLLEIALVIGLAFVLKLTESFYLTLLIAVLAWLSKNAKNIATEIKEKTLKLKNDPLPINNKQSNAIKFRATSAILLEKVFTYTLLIGFALMLIPPFVCDTLGNFDIQFFSKKYCSRASSESLRYLEDADVR